LSGIIAEIFHTGQVYAGAVARYQAETDKIAKEGLDLLSRELNEGLKEARTAIGQGEAEAQQIEKSAAIEAGRIATELGGEVNRITSNQEIFAAETVGRHQAYYQMLLDSLGAERELRSYAVGVGLRYQDPERGFAGRRVFDVSHRLTTGEAKGICAFECFRIGSDGKCADQWHEDTPSAPKRERQVVSSSDWNLTFSDANKIAIGEYRETLRDLEAVVIQDSLDLQRYKKLGTGVMGEDARAAVNAELARGSIGLQNIRRELNLISQIEYLDANTQRSTTGAAYYAKHVVRPLLGGSVTSGSDEVAIASWIATELPARIKRTNDELRRELHVGASGLHWSSRPILANLWFITHRGTFDPTALISRSSSANGPPPGSLSAVTGTQAGTLWPTLILLVPVAGLGIGAILAYRRFGGRFVGFVAVLSVLLIFPIQSALRANLNTTDSTETIIKGTTSSFGAYPFAQQAAQLKSDLGSTSETERKNLISDATVRGNNLQAEADRKGRTASTLLPCLGAAVVEVSTNDYRIAVKWAGNRMVEGVPGAQLVYRATQCAAQNWTDLYGPRRASTKPAQSPAFIIGSSRLSCPTPGTQ
jgi:hypothetical protein